jgi:hypothetical protein
VVATPPRWQLLASVADLLNDRNLVGYGLDVCAQCSHIVPMLFDSRRRHRIFPSPFRGSRLRNMHELWGVAKAR